MSPGGLEPKGSVVGEAPVGSRMRHLRATVAVALAAVCLGWLAWTTDWDAVAAASSRLDPAILGLAYVASTASVLCKALRWRALYPSPDRPRLGLAVAAVALRQGVDWARPF